MLGARTITALWQTVTDIILRRIATVTRTQEKARTYSRRIVISPEEGGRNEKMKLEKIAPENTPAKRNYPNEEYYHVIDPPPGWYVTFGEYIIVNPFRPGYIVHGIAYFSSREYMLVFRVPYGACSEVIDAERERVYTDFFATPPEEREKKVAKILYTPSKLVEVEEK